MDVVEASDQCVLTLVVVEESRERVDIGFLGWRLKGVFVASEIAGDGASEEVALRGTQLLVSWSSRRTPPRKAASVRGGS